MLVPKEVFGITTHADPESVRYALGGILFERKDGKPFATATDGRRLVHLTWDEDDRSEYPALDGIDREPVEGFVGILPIKACQDAAKMVPKGKRWKPIFNNVLLDEHGKDSVSLGTTDLENAKVVKQRLLEGRFPKWRDVVPQYQNHDAVRICVDPLYLAEVAKTARSFCTEDDRGVVLEIPIHGDGPVTISNGKNRQVKMTGVLMPLEFEGLTDDKKWRNGNWESCRRYLDLPPKDAEKFIQCLTVGQLKHLLRLAGDWPAEDLETTAAEAEAPESTPVEATPEAIENASQAYDTDLEDQAEPEAETDLELSPLQLQELIEKLVAEQLAAVLAT